MPTIIERLKIRFNITPDKTNLIIDDLWPRFLQDIQHTEGSAVEMRISSVAFTEANIVEMLNDGLIYLFHRAANPDGSVDEDPTAPWVVYADKDRFSRFDPTVLQTLEKSGAVLASKHKSWD